MVGRGPVSRGIAVLGRAWWCSVLRGEVFEMRDAVVIEAKFGSLRLCVPGAWSDAQALEFAEDSEPCGASQGWRIRGERVGCKDGDGFVHLVVSL
jgi:hypothetical protein